MATRKSERGTASPFCFLEAGRSGDFLLQFGAGLADLRGHQRTILNLKKKPLGLLTVPRCGLLHLVEYRQAATRHLLALLDALDHLRAHGLDLFCSGLVLPDNTFRRQLADL